MTERVNLARLLLDAFRWFDDALRGAVEKQLGVTITSAQSLLFAELPSAGATQADLARRLGVTRQAVNDLVRRLVADDLVEVVADPDSDRTKLVRPTAMGKRSIRLALRTFADVEEELVQRIGSEEVEQLRSALGADWGEPPLI